MNYEARLEGYRRIDGYERHDGRKSPSDDFSDDPNTRLQDIEARRALIGKVPGEGDIHGVWRYRDRTYAIRNDSDGIPTLHRSSENGWETIDLGWIFEYRKGLKEIPKRGDTLTAFGSEAEVVAVHQASGTWLGGDAAGLLVLRWTGEAGDWPAGTVVTVGGDSARTLILTTSALKQRIASGTRFRFANYNFFAQRNLERMYGICNGTGVGANVFEFDGETFFTLRTGVTTDRVPVDIAAHQNHLFVAYQGGSVVHSNLGDPRGFDAVLGAAEFAIGDEVTGLLSGYRDTLIVWGRNRTLALLGSGAANWQMRTISLEAGGMLGTGALMDEPVCLDDRGIRTMQATEAYGDLDIAVVSEQIRPLLDHIRDGGVLPVAAIRVRRKSQYRIFFDDGQCITASYLLRGKYRSIEFTRTNYDLYDHAAAPDYAAPGVVNAICSLEDSDGRERIFFSLKGSPYVYEMDAGTSFDGHRIQSYIRLPYNDFGHSEMIKRYRKITLECDSTYRSRFRLAADFADDREAGGSPEEFEVTGSRSVWDEAAWSDFDWDAIPQRVAEARISGRGRNISILVTADQTVEPSHTFSGATVFFDPRKMRR